MKCLVNARAISLLVATLCLTAALNAQDQKQKQDKLTDRQFVEKASAGNLAEIKLGKLASERAGEAEVKKFGQRMVDDHTKANQELMTIASQKGMTPSAKPEAKHQEVENKLSKLQGAEFDRAYLMHMVKSHEMSAELHANQAKSGQDAELRAFAAKVLPTVKDHLQMARDLSKQGKNR